MPRRMGMRHERSGSGPLLRQLCPFSPSHPTPPACPSLAPVPPLPAEVMALAVELCFDDLDAPPERITGVEVPMPYAANLEAASLPQVQGHGLLYCCC